jgi:hypothetical protein
MLRELLKLRVHQSDWGQVHCELLDLRDRLADPEQLGDDLADPG